MEADQANLSSWKKQIDMLERDGKTDEAAKLRAKCRELERNRAKPLRLIADDITAEALTSLLAENKGLMTIISTEGGLFDTLAGRYSNNISIDTFCCLFYKSVYFIAGNTTPICQIEFSGPKNIYRLQATPLAIATM